METTVPELRIRRANARRERPDGDYVLYWMTAARRVTDNFALQHAVDCASAWGRPLMVFEPLRIGYGWASPRFHQFVIDGMADNEARLREKAATYFAYVEPVAGAGRGLLEALAERACLVVADEYPTFFLPRMVAAAAARIDVAMDVVDGNGLLPLRAHARAWPSAYSFRRHLQKTLHVELPDFPRIDPFEGVDLVAPVPVPEAISSRWRSHTGALSELPIDQSVGPTGLPGGSVAAEASLARFVALTLGRYTDDRNHPDKNGVSGLSPWLHFGHLGAHRALRAVMRAEQWNPGRLGLEAKGKREGFWGMSPDAEAWMDQLVTWRELGYGFCHHNPDDHASFESLPTWAQTTLNLHAGDERPWLYTPDQLEGAETHDPIWNAAQTELVRHGRIHNYLRMLWGKKILEWSPSPQAALSTVFALNDKYALDGRDPNSVSGITWTFGRFDRPWGPERPIFGKIRYMTSQSTARKVRLKAWQASLLA